MIAIIDYEIGNLAAVANMLHRLGASCEITGDAEKIELADKIILPGNGAFDACMRNLRATGLVPLLERRVISNHVPLLGICVGAQMLGSGSAEGQEAGLGWVDMSVKRFPELPDLRVPHMGWNRVAVRAAGHPLARGMDFDTRFYYVHSYYMAPANPEDILFTTDYGITFASGVARANIVGVQFHPEKSHRFGKHLLGNFVKGP